MPDTPTAGASQADAPAANSSPQAGEPTTSPTPQAGSGTKAPLSADDYERLLTEKNKEAASYRTRLKAFEDAEAQRQQAALSDLEKANQRAEAAEARIKEQQKALVAAQVKLAAQQKGIIDPDLAALAIEGKLDYGDDGMPTNLDKALNDLLTQKPFLAPTSNRPAPSSGGATNPGRAAASGGAMTMEYAQQILGGKVRYETLSQAEQAAFRQFMQSQGLSRR